MFWFFSRGGAHFRSLNTRRRFLPPRSRFLVRSRALDSSVCAISAENILTSSQTKVSVLCFSTACRIFSPPHSRLLSLNYLKFDSQKRRPPFIVRIAVSVKLPQLSKCRAALQYPLNSWTYATMANYFSLFLLILLSFLAWNIEYYVTSIFSFYFLS